MDREVLIGAGPMFAVDDAIVLGVMGKYDEARSLIQGFLPELIGLLADSRAFETFAEHERLGRLALLSKDAYVANWLLSGRFDARLGRLALDAMWDYFRFMSPKAKPDGVLLLNTMLLKIESGRYESAKELYERFEKTPMKVPPDSLRFARNPRALVYAHLHEKSVPQEFLAKARHSFRNAATQWEKDVCPILYVLLPDAARILSASLRLVREPHAPVHIFGLLR